MLQAQVFLFLCVTSEQSKKGMDFIMKNNLQIIKEVVDKENIKYDISTLENIVLYAEEIYKDTKKANIKMMDHVIGVATIVASLRLDDISFYVSLLHGVVKCNTFDKKEFERKFGREILQMVLTVDKLSCLNLKGKEKLDSDNLRNMFMAIAKDIRTVIIKLADRLYNMQNIKNIDNEEVKNNMAKECLSVYAPIAHRLGMSQIKSELEDISFRILMDEEYHIVKEQIDEKKQEREKYIKNRIKEIEKSLKSQGIETKVYGRPKHFYSIYKKMTSKNCKADDLFDLLAIRIIVDSIKDCYTSLGIVHDMYKPMPGRFKDYIAMPKTNMYQSLHTTVFGEGGRPFEIQIRTWDMHKIADYGIAAHFAYKEKKTRQTEADKKLVWLRKALEIQHELEDTSENIKNMKVELFGEEVFVFTPKGDIKALPKGSTPIDFAYSIHQKVAEKIVGAKINSKMVPISTKLENTDIVEIVTSNTAKGPTRDWLKYVKTSSAKNKITSYIKNKGKIENIQRGKESFEKVLKKQKIEKDKLLNSKNLKIVLGKFNFKTIEEAYENIGFGSISPVKIINKLIELYEKDEIQNEKIETKMLKRDNKSLDINSYVLVENIANCKLQLAKCCLPIPGDAIVGYVTNANGVSVHRANCNNLLNLDMVSRKINVSWKKQAKIDSKASIKISANNRQNILTDIIQELSTNKINLLSIVSKVTQDREIIIDIVISIPDVHKLQSLMKKIKKIDSVFEVKRSH